MPTKPKPMRVNLELHRSDGRTLLNFWHIWGDGDVSAELVDGVLRIDGEPVSLAEFVKRVERVMVNQKL